MYPLGRQFEVDYTRSKSDDKTFVKGNNFRITVITERVVRLEYSPSGSFVDRPTPVSYTHLDVYKRQILFLNKLTFLS